MKIGTRLVNMSVAAAVAGALLGSLVPSIDASAAAVAQVTNNVPRLVNSATFTGHHNPKAVLDIKVALSLQNTDKLAAYMQEVHDKTSPNYHKYLTPKQFTALYCPSAAQVQAVEQFLKQRGISVTKVSPNNTRVYGSASTAVVESALGVAINDYKGPDGSTFYSASTDPSLPSTISGYVKAVMGLDDAVQYQSHAILKTTPAPAAVSAPLPGGYSPQQIATAYGWPSITSTTNGGAASGITIAIATAYTYRPADIQKFWSTYKLPTHTLTNVAIDGLTTRLEAETTLDIERSSAMSPGSKIVVFEAADPGDPAFDDTFLAIANDVTHNIKVMSTSWGLAENESAPASIAAEHDDFVQLNSEGITLLAAAGDNSASDNEAPGTDNADFPASDPYVLAAGGTELAVTANDPIASSSNESAWSNSGGADSIYFAQTSDQAHVSSYAPWTPNTSCSGDFTTTFTPAPLSSTAPPTLGTDGCANTGDPSRQSSDMSMNAGPDFSYSVYFNGRWGEYYGTSFVAPELAGLFAILVARNGGNVVGSGPHVVYCNAAATGGNDFNDIVSGGNGNGLAGSTFDAGLGWDHPTGWGTPQAGNFLSDAIANTCF